MKKGLIFSFVGHLVIFIVLVGVSRQKPQKENLYPEVFEVSVVNFTGGSPGGPGGNGNGTSANNASAVTNGVSFVNKTKTSTKSKPKSAKENITGPGNEFTLGNGPGGSGLGLRIGGKGGKYSYYVDAVLTKISSNWANPFAGSGVRFSSTVYFVIRKDGKITSVKVEKSSGNELFDRSAERAVILTQNVPALAGEFANQDSLKLHLEFEYKP
jgi:TonB family protein